MKKLYQKDILKKGVKLIQLETMWKAHSRTDELTTKNIYTSKQCM